ncbi:hypothetical protein BVG16_07705 [Paenibacillus selenitireducens]|uniref:Butirosin biosynthesis protein H N-terminal domain-containing protein n=1 Tax=Paenibacillus selenitireducens TaxID=1324314 RepID=A0A1T2XLQ4_9BACL|nr:hypothetical protein [Paenibacillus selenitireducens]OPA80593.1 hypothetical protein BVG16_07705 [Paenibacillus selenitireducens]
MMGYLQELQIDQFPRITKNITPSYCFDDCIATFATSMGIDYELVYLDALMMWFDSGKIHEGLGKSIINDYDITVSFEKYTNIGTNKYSGDYDYYFNDIIEKMHSGSAICISILGYYCPWDWRYQEIKDGAHAFFITEYDEINDLYTCLDPYYDKKDICLPGENIRNGFQSFREFFLTKNTKCFPRMTLLRDVLTDINFRQTIDSFKGLGEGIKNNFQLNIEIEEFDEENDYAIDEIHGKMFLNQELKEMVHNCVRFSVLLSKFAEWYPVYEQEFLTTGIEMKIIAEKWEMIRFQLLKMLFASNYQKVSESICRRIYILVDEEKELIQKILNIVNRKNEVKTINQSDVYNSGANEYIDLDKYFNNKGISTPNSQIADFNGIGEYVLEQSLKTISSDFKLPDYKSINYDNISCMQQIISVENVDYYTEVLLLGCSEWGSYKDYFIIIYDDDTFDKILVELYDWTPNSLDDLEYLELVQCEKTIFGEIVEENITEKCFIYILSRRINAQKKVKAVKLPECENMHIFALTLKLTKSELNL